MYEYNPANTPRWNNDVFTLAQRLRRWPNIKTSLFKRVLFSSDIKHDNLMISR